MNILFTFENPVPSPEADAEVFLSTAKSLARSSDKAQMHLPVSCRAENRDHHTSVEMEVVPAIAPLKPAALRHLCCGLTLGFRQAFRNADLIYTRNLWVATMALVFRRRVVFDHYRPWPEQIPPIQPWLYWMIRHRRFVVHICHSDYTRQRYLRLGAPPRRLHTVHNGYQPTLLGAALDIAAAKRSVNVDRHRKTVVYTGRINHKKGLHLVIEASRRLPEILFLLVGSYGDGPIERSAKGLENVRFVEWQPQSELRRYIFAADVLLIPPSRAPLTEFGSTVLPLKVFLYLASGRPIVAGDTPDLREILTHDGNAHLCRPDCVDSLVEGIRRLTGDPGLAQRLAAAAKHTGEGLTWEARAEEITRIIDERMRSAPEDGDRGTWGWLESRNWIRQSLRWFANLLIRRSWVLPPAVAKTRSRHAG